jgi:MFS transporter, DHA2 family, multidrug resistance protein
MTDEAPIRNFGRIVQSNWRVLVSLFPGLIMSALHSSMLVVPRADFIDALDSDRYRIQWITGAYVVGTAAGMSLTRFVGSLLGLRRAYLLGVLCFTAAGTGCALVNEVLWMAPLRLVQGFGNGQIISVGMVLIWRTFPVEKAAAMALYGMAMFAPAVAGATLGGLLTSLLSWRLIFALILPLGWVAGLSAWRLLPHDEPGKQPPASLDLIGLFLLVSWIATMSVVLDMGQYWGWLNSPEFVPWCLAFVLSFTGFILWGLLAANPLINLRALARSNFTLGVSIKSIFSINLVVLLSLMGNYMVNLRGYQWWQASLVIAPALATMLAGLLVGAVWGSRRNRKIRMVAGLAAMSSATAALATVDLYTAKGLLAIFMALWGVGGLVIGPALLTAFEGFTDQQTLQAAGVFNIVRALPAVVVGGLLSIHLTQRTDAQFDVLRQNIRYNRPIVADSLRGSDLRFADRGNGPAAAKQSHAFLGKWVHANSRAFAFQGIFSYLALVPAAGLILVFLVRVRQAD